MKIEIVRAHRPELSAGQRNGSEKWNNKWAAKRDNSQLEVSKSLLIVSGT